MIKKLIVSLLLVILILVGCDGKKAEEKNIEESQIEKNDVNSDLTEKLDTVNESNEDLNELVDEQIDEESDFQKNEVLVVVDILNVRSDYNISSAIVSKLKKDDIVTIIDSDLDDENNTWYKIEYMKDNYAWIASWFCLDVYRVSTVEEFNESIDSNRIIILAPEMAELDIQVPTIIGVENLIIEGNIEEAQKMFTSRVETVLVFKESTNVTLRGLDIGHETEKGCIGDVIDLENCENFVIENSILFGCGYTGIKMVNSKASLIKSRVWDCYGSGFSLDSTSKLNIESSLIDKLPAVFDDFQYDLSEANIIINNSIIDSQLIDGAFYNDQMWRQGIGLYKLNLDYFNIRFNNSVYIPFSVDEIDLMKNNIGSLISIKSDQFSRVKVYPTNEGYYNLEIFIEYSKIEDKSKENLEKIILDISNEIKDLGFLSFDKIHGKIMNKSEQCATWEWSNDSNELLDFKVFYKYTEAFWGIESIDLKAYIDKIIDIPESYEYDLEAIILPSVLENGNIIHSAVYDCIRFVGDFPEYFGTFMSLEYNQTSDNIIIKIDKKSIDTFNKSNTIVNEVMADYDKMFQLLISREEYIGNVDSVYDYVYELSKEEVIFVENTIKKVMTEKMQRSFKERIGLEQVEGIIYSKDSLYDIQLEENGFILSFYVNDDLHVYYQNVYIMTNHKVIFVKEDGLYKMDQYTEMHLIDRESDWNLENDM